MFSVIFFVLCIAVAIGAFIFGRKVKPVRANGYTLETFRPLYSDTKEGFKALIRDVTLDLLRDLGVFDENYDYKPCEQSIQITGDDFIRFVEGK